MPILTKTVKNKRMSQFAYLSERNHYFKYVFIKAVFTSTSVACYWADAFNLKTIVKNGVIMDGQGRLINMVIYRIYANTSSD